ncbi:LysE family translocator [Embleya sp. NPDC001921]
MITFLAAALVLTAVPGPNLVYILTRTLAQGRRAGVVSAAGVEAGTLVHVGVAVIGLASVIAASPTAFVVLEYAGAGYLAWLGVRTVLRRSAAVPEEGRGPVRSLRRVFLDGVLVNVLNPKVVLFFLAFLPQFVPSGASPAQARVWMLGLGASVSAIGLLVGLGYTFAADAARHLVRGGRPGRDRGRYVVGGVYLALGLLVAR